MHETPLLVQGAEASEPPIETWGRLDYATAVRRQRARARAIAECRAGEAIAVVEHPPVITVGRHASAGDITSPTAVLKEQGIAVARSDRGGRATYHGPGQAVVYPIISLARHHLGVRAWVGLLEHAICDVMASFRLEPRLREGHPGVWIGDAKIASLGLRIARNVSYHGVAINVDALAVEGFRHIIPCGMERARMTSMQGEGVVADPMVVGFRLAAAIRARLQP